MKSGYFLFAILTGLVGTLFIWHETRVVHVPANSHFTHCSVTSTNLIVASATGFAPSSELYILLDDQTIPVEEPRLRVIEHGKEQWLVILDSKEFEAARGVCSTLFHTESAYEVRLQPELEHSGVKRIAMLVGFWGVWLALVLTGLFVKRRSNKEGP